MYTVIKRTLDREIIPFTALIGSLFLFTIVLRYFLFPLWQSGAEDRNKVFRYKALISDRSEYEELKTEIRKNQKRLEEKHIRLTEGLADPRDLSGLLQMIFDKAWEAGIHFDKTIPQQEVRSADYIQYPVQLEMQTDFHSFGKFISSLERIPQIVSVDRVAITALGQTSIEALLLITCFLNKKDFHGTDSTVNQ